MKEGVCSSCRRDSNGVVRKWSNENCCNPRLCHSASSLKIGLTICAVLDVPSCLRNLTDMEEMMLARVMPLMQVRYTKGHQLSYKEHIVNLPQDISPIATKLPRLPEKCDVIIIRRERTDMSNHIDFFVRREKVRDALQWKIAHDPDYADLEVDEDVLSQLPERGSVVDRIPMCRQGTATDDAGGPVGPNEAAESDVSDEILDADDGGEIGQAIGGVLDLGNDQRLERDRVRDGANAVIRQEYEQRHIVCMINTFIDLCVTNSIQFPAPNLGILPIHENTPGYMTKAFPTLFPDGEGDFYQARVRKITLGEYFTHLLRFRGGRFAWHRRFPWFAFNTLQRHRSRDLSKVFVKQQHTEGRMTAGDLRHVLSEGDESVTNKMLRYGAHLRGTRAFWLARRKELIDQIEVLGSPHAFFTLSAADLQWPDLHRHMPKEIDVPTGDERAARRQRRLALERNPHLAATYLDERLKLFMKFIVMPTLNVDHFWYRYEWQERGSCHIHGFLWMKDAPDAEKIDWEVLKNPDSIVTEDEQKRMDDFVAFWDTKISAANPFPREDENTPLLGQHPCNKDRNTLQNTKEELAEMLNWVERHTKCMPGYCKVKQKVAGQEEPRVLCRFDYPMACRSNAGVGFDSKFRVRFEPRRNDRLLNNYNVPMILGWRANIDMKPVLSKDAAIS